MKKKVKISEFKAHLSAYLKEVKKGATITILDRENPVAELSPPAAATKTKVRLQVRPAKVPGGLKNLKLSGLDLPISVEEIVNFVREERGSR